MLGSSPEKCPALADDFVKPKFRLASATGTSPRRFRVAATFALRRDSPLRHFAAPDNRLLLSMLRIAAAAPAARVSCPPYPSTTLLTPGEGCRRRRVRKGLHKCNRPICTLSQNGYSIHMGQHYACLRLPGAAEMRRLACGGRASARAVRSRAPDLRHQTGEASRFRARLPAKRRIVAAVGTKQAARKARARALRGVDAGAAEAATAAGAGSFCTSAARASSARRARARRPLVRLENEWSYSATGTRTRVARVRAEYPSQLDYSGSCGLQAQALFCCNGDVWEVEDARKARSRRAPELGRGLLTRGQDCSASGHSPLSALAGRRRAARTRASSTRFRAE